jgi:transcriptional regulator with XRE-family HTH domain
MNNHELKTALKTLKLKQSELARAVGCNPRQVRRWISGFNPVPESVALVVNVQLMLRGK